MKALWVDSGNDPDFVKVDGFTHLFFDMFDPRITRAYLVWVESKGFKTGLYMVTNWPQFVGKTGKQVAEIVDDRVSKVGTKVTKIQFDMEEHDPDFILAVLQRWRQLRPKQDTSWTMESWQGGWMSPEFVQEILSLRVRVVPQYYKGNMEVAAQDVGLKDMLKAGFPYEIVTGFYDAAALPWGWEGFAFTMGRLP